MKPFYFVLLVLFVVSDQASSFQSSGATKALFVRKNVYSPEAKPDLDAMRIGIAKMKSLPCTDPRSWYYQGAIHHLPDTITGRNELCPEYQNKSQYRPGWATCPHMLPDKQQYHFLPWHRLYTYYFEKLVRHFSGKADFAMPYWDYNRPDQRTMPAAFRVASLGGRSNPLYEQGRSRFLLEGNPIASNDSDAVVMNVQILGRDTIIVVADSPMQIILDTTYLWTASDFQHFSYEMEDGMHNCMHDYIGGAVDSIDTSEPIYNRIYQQASLSLQGLMADVPSAGFDPIFFLHHANLDRIWAQWNLDFPSKAMTRAEFLQAGQWTYTFFDVNGKAINYTMQQVYDTIQSVDYTYDDLITQAPASPTAVVGERWKTSGVLASLEPRKLLGNPYDRYTVALNRDLRKRDRNRQLISMEMDLSFERKHDTWVVVMLHNERVAPGRKEYRKNVAGVAGFFGAIEHAGHGDHDHADHTPDKIRKTLRYDITDELESIRAFGTRAFQVAFQQHRADPQNPMTIERIVIREFTAE